jgi:NAD/NADP transhydrogenase alpha subunit
LGSPKTSSGSLFSSASAASAGSASISSSAGFLVRLSRFRRVGPLMGFAAAAGFAAGLEAAFAGARFLPAGMVGAGAVGG